MSGKAKLADFDNLQESFWGMQNTKLETGSSKNDFVVKRGKKF